MIFNYTTNIVFEGKLKKRMILILNAICLLVLCYEAIDMTFDYLRFEFAYKLIVDDNNRGLRFARDYCLH